jgi:hypothetical protein
MCSVTVISGARNNEDLIFQIFPYILLSTLCRVSTESGIVILMKSEISKCLQGEIKVGR